MFEKECGYYDEVRFRTWLPYTINNKAEIIHDITGEAYDLGEDYFVSTGPTRALTLGMTFFVAYFGDMVTEKGRLSPWYAEGHILSTNCAMCVIPSSVRKPTVINLRGFCRFSAFDEV